MDINELVVKVIGTAVAEAIESIDSNGFVSRIASEDGQSLALTCDYQDNRLALDVVAGKVVKASIG
jgi:hypothetical protein